MKNKNLQGKQIRYTLEDTLRNQRKLSNLLKLLIQENRCITFDEKKMFYSLLPKALLGQGATEPVSMVIDHGWFTFSSLQNMALRLADITSSHVELNTSRPEKLTVRVDVKDLWQFLYDKILYFFPLACAEAVHISGENIPRTEQGEYSFSSKANLEGV